MLLNGHDLDGVVAVGRYARQGFRAELLIASHLFLLLCHADMAFVDKQRIHIGAEILHPEFIWVLRSIYLG